MALLRAELRGNPRTELLQRQDGSLGAQSRGIYDGIIEAARDLALDWLTVCDPGSLLYCLEDGAIYVKSSAGTWEEAAQ